MKLILNFLYKGTIYNLLFGEGLIYLTMTYPCIRNNFDDHMCSVLFSRVRKADRNAGMGH